MDLEYGEFCWSMAARPARYVGKGMCLFVTSDEEGLCLDAVDFSNTATPTSPVPSDEALRGAAAGALSLLPYRLEAERRAKVRT